MTRPPPAFAALLVVVGLPGAGHAQSPLARPVVDTVSRHIVRVMNDGPAAWADTNGWRLVLERTVQPPEGSPGMLERPTGLLLLADGRIIVSQRNPTMIRVYDRQGRLENTIGREGDGPGEFRAPKIAVYHDTLVIHDARLGRTALMTVGGAFIRQFVTNIHADGPPISVDDRGRLRVQNVVAAAGTFQAQWVYLDLNGRRIDSLVPPSTVNVRTWAANLAGGGRVSYTVPFSPQDSYAFRNDGMILYGGGDRYEFLITRTGRDTVRMFGRRGVAGNAIPATVRDSVFRRYAANPQLQGIGITESDLPRTYSVWSEVALDGAENVWVASGRPQTPGYHFDVFNPAGVYLGAVAARFDGLWRASWAGDHVAVLDTDDNDLPRIRIFRIDRHGH